ncbi:hypothetical protein WG66_008050 [Moniliophthora roreri]|nr:hypothetical protein WG66_008050 [Moniliophthora roreri]
MVWYWYGKPRKAKLARLMGLQRKKPIRTLNDYEFTQAVRDTWFLILLTHVKEYWKRLYGTHCRGSDDESVIVLRSLRLRLLGYLCGILFIWLTNICRSTTHLVTITYLFQLYDFALLRAQNSYRSYGMIVVCEGRREHGGGREERMTLEVRASTAARG